MKKNISWKKLLIQCAAGVVFGLLAILDTYFPIVTPDCTYTMEESFVLLCGLFFGLPGGIISASIIFVHTLIGYLAYPIYFIAGILGGLVYTFVYSKGTRRLFFGIIANFIEQAAALLYIVSSNFENISYIMSIFNGGWIYAILPGASLIIVTLLVADLIDYRKEKKSSEDKPQKKTWALTLKFQSVLAIAIVIATVATVASTYILQTKVASSDAKQVIEANLCDAVDDLEESMNDYLFGIVRNVKSDVKRSDKSVDELQIIARRYDVNEVYLIGKDNHVFASSDESMIGFDMSSTEQSAEFECLLQGKLDYSQDAMPKGSDDSQLFKYVGEATDYGYVQIGVNESRLRKIIESDIVQTIKNRRISKNGFMVVLSEELRVLVDGRDHQYTTLDAIGLEFDPETMEEVTLITTMYGGEEHFMEYSFGSGYYVLGMIPKSEVMQGRSLSNWLTVLTSGIIFSVLFAIIYFLMHSIVIRPIHIFNRGLNDITAGNLDVVIEPKPNNVTEFYNLSNDVNATVSKLKELIAEAERRIEKELEFAKNIQEGALERVFPPFPDDKRFDLHATMDAAKDVGGDFYDFYFVDQDHLCLTIADVSGKGIPAAMFMMTAKTLLKSNVLAGKPINEALRISNDELCAHNDAGMFVTCWAGILNLQTGDMEFTCAGHNPPVVRHGEVPWEYHRSKINLVLAAMEGVPYDKNTLHLNPGDEIFMYTDGVTEATNINDELYEEQRLNDCLNSKAIDTSREVCRYVRESVDAFVGEAPQFDDITMLSFKYYGPVEEETK